MLNDGDEILYPPSSSSFLHNHLHIKEEEARKKRVMHFGHEHPLTFKEDVRKGFEGELLCNCCGIEIGIGGFTCSMEKCNGFNLHEFCVSLPKEMKDYPNHSQHPLILYTHPPNPNYNYKCDVCDNHYMWATPFFYHCEVCLITAELARSGSTSNVAHCLNVSNMTAICMSSNYSIHQAHMQYALYVGDKIIETSEEQDRINDKLIQFPLPFNEVVRDTLAQFIKNTCEPEDVENGHILKHPSHGHQLTLEVHSCKFTRFDYSSTTRCDYEVCNACMLPLLNNTPIYSFNETICNFDLHKWCAELPRELKHPAHLDIGHTLILQENLKECFGFFRCKGCKEIGNGFAYKCNKCEGYYLDVRCATLPKFVKHETHDHPLLLKYGRSIGGCISCGIRNFIKKCDCKICNYSSTISPCFSSFSFGCDACHFSIHPKCLIMPQEIVHWYDEHGFKLTYSTHDVSTSNDNQGAAQDHCEFCERKILSSLVDSINLRITNVH
ncbi:uncharacterized protein LOC124916031 [Impatiens glandulifera]|uniref:uncharacterized protein LOC124916031 n=1 Tax=Impatiens glandulifera TaxID=253017 RepID=UPI001FB1670B|nr:uncharacterized protein LOC124916031 [Impatiens glandulifera]